MAYYEGRSFGVAVLAAMWVVLMLAAAAVPAFAQDSGSAKYGGDNNSAICQNVIEELNIGGQSGDAAAVAIAQYHSNAEAVAVVAQELNISINMVNVCLNTFVVDGNDNGNDNGDDTSGGDDDTTGGDDTTAGDDTTGAGAATTTAVPSKGVIASTIPEKGLLPVTGGMPLLSSGVLLGVAIIGTGVAILRAETRRGSSDRRRSDES
jgi:hypothetical protein